MSETSDKGDKAIKPAEGAALQTKDAAHARNADAATIAHAENLRTNKSNGSLEPGRAAEHSFNISLADGNGGYTALVNRDTKLTEKDLASLQKKSIGLLELVALQESGDKQAKPLVDQYEAAMKLRCADKVAEMARLQLLADQTYGRGDFAPKERPILTLEGHVETDETALTLRHLAQSYMQADAAEKKLILDTAADAFSKELSKQCKGIAEGVVAGNHDAVMGFVHAGLSGVQLVDDLNVPKHAANFVFDCMFDKEAAVKSGADTGTAIGKGLAAGFVAYQNAANYANDWRVSEDPIKLIRDVLGTLQRLDNAWDDLPTGEKAKRGTEFVVSWELPGSVAKVAEVAKEVKWAEIIEPLRQPLQETPAFAGVGAEGAQWTLKIPNGAEGSRASEYLLQQSRFESPLTGKGLDPALAAKEAGIKDAGWNLKKAEEKKELLEPLGYKHFHPRCYHIGEGEASEVIDEAKMAKQLNVSESRLRSLSRAELESLGITPIEPVNGHMPKNFEYAGRIYSIEKENPEVFKDLCEKFPDLVEQFRKGIQFSKDGYPDFKPFRQAKLAVFEHPFTTRLQDNLEADRYLWPGCSKSFGKKMRDEYSLVWHHLEARPGQPPRLELLPSELHKALQHTGGYAVKKTVRKQLND
ncbi:MAG: HNH endonuclease [Candidatus Obscuribacterales bacterium]|nr:HNH endonuclease [Candidatus Obscuribacterales bacterium]